MRRRSGPSWAGRPPPSRRAGPSSTWPWITVLGTTSPSSSPVTASRRARDGDAAGVASFDHHPVKPVDLEGEKPRHDRRMTCRMNRLGLALSGGGFRASLYHLGLVRFLRDGGILPRISHITSVSGGSTFAAHLALNWDRYNGSPGEFDAAAAEVLAYLRLDVRNRIARRFLLALPLRGPRRL